MGREIKRVSLDFSFPIGESYHDAMYKKHKEEAKCSEEQHEHEECAPYSLEPPSGEGWQLWQTVSDGPTSPVFATADALIEWMCQPVPRTHRKAWAPEAYPSNPWAQGWRREIAEPFVKSKGWAPSFVRRAGGDLVPGPEALVKKG
jgi:hypothetical protein